MDIVQKAGVPGNKVLDYQQMFENSPVAFYICDAEGKITYFNEAAVTLWGRTPIINQEILSGYWEVFYPDGTPMPLTECPMATALKTGRAERSEIRIKKPDESFRTILEFPQPQFNEKHEISGACNTLVDITDQQKDHIKQSTLSAIVESSDDAIVSKDLNGIITSWNSGAERIFGYKEKETIGKSINILIPKDRLDEENHIITNIKRGNRVDHIETIRLDKNGREIPISVTVSPVKDASGRIVGASKVARDISERLRVEEKQAILSAIVESSDDGIISKNLNSIIMSWNRGAEKIFGYSEKEVIGKSITLLIPEARMEEENLILSKIKSGGKVDHFETFRRHKSGKEIPISITVSPIKDSRGKVIGASKVARDITAQVEAQLALKRYIRNLETLNIIGKSISENLDVKGILQRVTNATTELTGAAYGAFLYNNIDEKREQFSLYALSGISRKAFEEWEMQQHIELFNPNFDDNRVIRIDDITKLPDYDKKAAGNPFSKGKYSVVNYMAVPVILKSGAVMGCLVYGHPKAAVFTEEHALMVVNIAAQAAISLDNSELFEQVKSLSDKKDEFIALASHELKTPLTTIKGYLQVLSRTEKEKMPKLFLKKSLYQVNKLKNLVEDLLNMSRIEAGRLNFSPEEFDLNKMLQEIIETFSYSTRTHKIISDLSTTPVFIKADKQRIEQAILNLLTNAIKYSPKANAVYVNLEVSDLNVTVCVKDEGIGLTKKQIGRLFTRFYRAEDIQGISGLGLGLYLTKQIIDRHGGSINVSSNYGEGSEFCFTLPLKANIN